MPPERGNERFPVKKVPQTAGAHLGQCVADLKRAAQPQHVVRLIASLDPGKAILAGRGHEFLECQHGQRPLLMFPVENER
jgi:hypothetical protein